MFTHQSCQKNPLVVFNKLLQLSAADILRQPSSSFPSHEMLLVNQSLTPLSHAHHLSLLTLTLPFPGLIIIQFRIHWSCWPSPYDASVDPVPLSSWPCSNQNPLRASFGSVPLSLSLYLTQNPLHLNLWIYASIIYWRVPGAYIEIPCTINNK